MVKLFKWNTVAIIVGLDYDDLMMGLKFTIVALAIGLDQSTYDQCTIKRIASQILNRQSRARYQK